MTVRQGCGMCGTAVEGADDDGFVDAFVAHCGADHSELPYPEIAIRNFGAALLRLTGPSERLDTIGEIAIHPVTEDRIDDWLAFFDHDGFVGCPQWAACYCSEPFVVQPGDAQPAEGRHWEDNRALVVDLLRKGQACGYLAYVDGRPAGWVNASRRDAQATFRRGEGAEPADDDVASVSCFVIGPAYRRHGLSRMLLDRVVADAAGRGCAHVEAYPFKAGVGDGGDADFRGPRALYDDAGFDEVKERAFDVVVRRTP